MAYDIQASLDGFCDLYTCDVEIFGLAGNADCIYAACLSAVVAFDGECGGGYSVAAEHSVATVAVESEKVRIRLPSG